LCCLARAPCDVVLGAGVGWVGEDFIGVIIFDQMAKIKKGSLLGDAGGLSHRMCYDDNAIFVFEFIDEFFETGRGNRV